MRGIKYCDILLYIVFLTSSIYARRQDCGKLTTSIHNACDKHVGKYQSRENYHRKKQTELYAKIIMLENHIPDLPNSRHEV